MAKRRMALLWSLVLCTVALMPPPAAAQESADGDARALFSQALGELRVGHFPEARDLLERSLALAPNPGTGFNLAVACRGTGELLRAERVLGALIAGEYGTIAEAQHSEAEAFLESVRSEIATLVVSVDGPLDAELRVDGRRVALEDRRIEVRVDPGERVVLASARDHESSERHVAVGRGQRVELEISLTPRAESLVGRLSVEAPDPATELEIVGVARGVGHLEEVLEPGEYVVRAGAREVSLAVRAGSQTRYVFDEVREVSIAEEPALWITLGLIVAAGLAGLVVGLALEPQRTAPVRDPAFGVVVALELP